MNRTIYIKRFIKKLNQASKSKFFVIGISSFALLLVAVMMSFYQQYQLFADNNKTNTTGLMRAGAEKAKKPEYAPGEVIVKFKNGTPLIESSSPKKFDTNSGGERMNSLNEATIPRGLLTTAKKYPITMVEPLFSLARTKIRDRNAVKPNERKTLENLTQIYKVQLDKGIDAQQVVNMLKSQSDVEYAELNSIYSIDVKPNDPEFDNLWGLYNPSQDHVWSADINATEAWDRATESVNTIVAVIDTGIDYNHPDLAENIWKNEDEIPSNSIDDDANGYVDDIRGWNFFDDNNDPMDMHRHGTHVAGIIGAVGNNNIGIAGVNWKIKIVPLRVMSPVGWAYTADTAQAIVYATDNSVKVTNNSYTGTESRTIGVAIAYADSKGTLVVAAAGNGGEDHIGDDNDTAEWRWGYPSTDTHNNVIAVAALDTTGKYASFSNYGRSSVDLAAPGTFIYSTVPNNSYAYSSGTSMATPYVSGAIALIWDKRPELSVLDIKNLLLKTTDPVPEVMKTQTDGRLNLSRALKLETITPSKFTVNARESFGDIGEDVGSGIAYDSVGNKIIFGNFRKDITFGSMKLSTASLYDLDGFLVSYDNGGKPMWVKQIGNDSKLQKITDMVLDSQNNIYIIGDYIQTVTVGSHSLTTSSQSVFVTKILSDGTVEWLRNGSNISLTSTKSKAITIDPNTGDYTVLFVDNNTDEKIMTKYNSNGQQKWQYKSDRSINDIASASDGSIYSAGHPTIVKHNAITGAEEKRSSEYIAVLGQELKIYLPSNSLYVYGSYDINTYQKGAVMKFSNSLEHIWHKQIAYNFYTNKEKDSLHIRSNGDVFFFSKTSSDIVVDNYLLPHNESAYLDPYLLGFDNDGYLKYALLLDGNDEIDSLSMASNGNLITIGGVFAGELKFDDSNVLVSKGVTDIFFADITLENINPPVFAPTRTPTPFAPTPTAALSDIETTIQGYAWFDKNVNGAEDVGESVISSSIFFDFKDAANSIKYFNTAPPLWNYLFKTKSYGITRVTALLPSGYDLSVEGIDNKFVKDSKLSDIAYAEFLLPTPVNGTEPTYNYKLGLIPTDYVTPTKPPTGPGCSLLSCDLNADGQTNSFDRSFLNNCLETPYDTACKPCDVTGGDELPDGTSCDGEINELDATLLEQSCGTLWVTPSITPTRTPTKAPTKTPTPTLSLPSNLTSKCSADNKSVTLSWKPSSTSVNYSVRLDNMTNAWSNNCAKLNSGDKCSTVSRNTITFAISPRTNYRWWIQMVRPNGTSVGSLLTGAKFSCPTSNTPTPSKAPTAKPSNNPLM